jgi:hypothetical protein
VPTQCIYLFGETVAVYCENHTKHINTLCLHNQLFNVTWQHNLAAALYSCLYRHSCMQHGQVSSIAALKYCLSQLFSCLQTTPSLSTRHTAMFYRESFVKEAEPTCVVPSIVRAGNKSGYFNAQPIASDMSTHISV